MKYTLGQVASALAGTVGFVLAKSVSTSARRWGVVVVQWVTDRLAQGIVILGFALLAACVFVAHVIRSDGMGGKK